MKLLTFKNSPVEQKLYLQAHFLNYKYQFTSQTIWHWKIILLYLELKENALTCKLACMRAGVTLLVWPQCPSVPTTVGPPVIDMHIFR